MQIKLGVTIFMCIDHCKKCCGIGCQICCCLWSLVTQKWQCKGIVLLKFHYCDFMLLWKLSQVRFLVCRIKEKKNGKYIYNRTFIINLQRCLFNALNMKVIIPILQFVPIL